MIDNRKNPIALPASANPGDGRIFDANGKIICWMGGAGLFEESEILARRNEIINALNCLESLPRARWWEWLRRKLLKWID